MSTQDPLKRLKLMGRRCRRLARAVAGRTENDFFDDEALEDRVVQNLMQIGEHVSQLRKSHPELLEKHPEIDWRRLQQMRNIIAHDYDQSSRKGYWHVASKRVPAMTPVIETMIATLQKGRDDARRQPLMAAVNASKKATGKGPSRA